MALIEQQNRELRAHVQLKAKMTSADTQSATSISWTGVTDTLTIYYNKQHTKTQKNPKNILQSCQNVLSLRFDQTWAPYKKRMEITFLNPSEVVYSMAFEE